MDALTALVNTLNLHAKLVYSGGVCGRWLMDHNSQISVWFHLVSKGQRFIHSPSWSAPLILDNGDLILFLPHAPRHYLSYSAEHLPGNADDTRMTPWLEGEAGFVCGEIELAAPKSLLWQALPAEIVIRQNQAGYILARLIELIISEASVQRFGSDSVSEKFMMLIGYSPIEYLTAWRLQIAAHWLMEPNMNVERVAERCGYESVPAFSKAFKRRFGVAPGAFRRT